ncbi:MAG: hypothetical protein RJA07_1150 [Bacteroidota bacterium]|jgi:N-acetylneuraminic acid mutarotase
MRLFLLFIFNFLGTTILLAQSPNTWTQKHDFGFNQSNATHVRCNGIGFSYNGKGYVGMGTGDYDFLSDMWEYDTLLHSWTQKASFPGKKRGGVVSFIINGKAYVGLGVDSQRYYKDFWEYDIITNTWFQKNDFAGTKRGSAIAFASSTNGYVGLGADTLNMNPLLDIWKYNPTNDSWVQKTSFPGQGRYTPNGFSIGENGFMLSGLRVNTYFQDFWEYYTANDSWVQKANFPGQGRTNAIMASYNGKGYVGGGCNTTNLNGPRDFYEYDTLTNTWTAKATILDTMRQAPVTFCINGNIYTGTGACLRDKSVWISPKLRNDFYKYSIANNSWQFDSYLGGIPMAGSLVFSSNNMGYLICGENGYGFNPRDVWKYNPNIDVWQKQTDFPAQPRVGGFIFSNNDSCVIGLGTNNFYPSITYDIWSYNPLQNGWHSQGYTPHLAYQMFPVSNSFVVGNVGYYLGIDGSNLPSIWAYNLTSKTWTNKNSFPAGYRFGMFSFWVNNKLYVGGGQASGTYYFTLYSYDPITNQWTQKANVPLSMKNIISDASSFTLGNLSYLCTGDRYPQTHASKECWQYNPATDKWRKLPDFPGIKRNKPIVMQIKNRIFMGLGNDSLVGSYDADWWEFNPGHQIALYPISLKARCPGDTIKIPLNVIGQFNTGNIFTAQLSDVNGSFNNPTNIGTIATVHSDTLTAHLTTNLISSQQYSIRVTSTNPPDTTIYGIDNLIIYPNSNPVAFILSPTKILCNAATVNLSIQLSNQGTISNYQWQKNKTNVGFNSSNLSSNTIANNDTIRCIITSFSPCINAYLTDTSNQVIIKKANQVYDTIHQQICIGDSMLFNQHYLKTAGWYNDTLTSLFGCDSILTMQLDINTPSFYSFNSTCCSNHPYRFHSKYYSITGSYTDALINHVGCDSLVTLNLTVNSVKRDTIKDTICSNQSYYFNNHRVYLSGIYYDTLASYIACDSFITLILRINPTTSSGYKTIRLCYGDSLYFNGQYRHNNAIYYDTTVNRFGCDSLFGIWLLHYPMTYPIYLHKVICSTDSIFFKNHYIKAAGNYYDTMLNHNGCDSVIILQLTVKQASTYMFTHTICSGSTYIFFGTPLSAAGTYTHHLNNHNNCDSMIVLSLVLLPTSSSTQSITICQGSNYNFYGSILNTAGIYTHHLINYLGCDSLITLHLSVTPVNITISQNGNTLTATASNSYQWLNCNNNQIIIGATSQSLTVTVSGSYAAIITQNGCTDTSNCLPIIISGTNNIDVKSELIIFPNPSDGKFYFKISSEVQERVLINIFDLTGKLIQQSTLLLHEGENRGSISSVNIDDGVYIIQFSSGQMSLNKKLVIQHSRN